jgi:phosphate transport system permease protein
MFMDKFSIKSRRSGGKFSELLMSKVFLICASFSIAALLLITLFLLAGGIPAIGEIGFFNFIFGRAWTPGNVEPQFGLLPMIMGSIYTTTGAILIGVPIGVFTAIFLAFMCPRPVYNFLKPAIQLLAGIPSVVYGFFGMMVLVPLIRNITWMLGIGGTGQAILTASILLGIMILPTIIAISESALKAAPRSYYEGALALGASHTRSVFKVVVPAAKSGIFASVILGIGRAIGETMAVMMVAGNQPLMPLRPFLLDGLFGGGRTLTSNIAMEMGYAHGLHREALIATGIVLVFFILTINLIFNLINRKRDPAKITLRNKIRHKILTGWGLSRSVDKLKFKVDSKRKLIRFTDGGLTWATRIFAGLTLTALLFVVFHILSNGVGHLTPQLFEWTWNTRNQSMMPSIIATLAMVVITLILVVPIGVFTSIYLVEYTKRGSRIVAIIRSATEILAGIPSIVYGLFGFLFFFGFLGLGYSLLGGALTLTIMILPLVIRTTEEALKAVPDTYREGAFALGSGKLRAVFRVILPSATPGILAGVILATGRIVGETAALIFTAGTIARIPTALTDSVRTLSVHMWELSNEGLHFDQAYATAVVLLIIVLLINAVSAFVARRITRN